MDLFFSCFLLLVLGHRYEAILSNQRGSHLLARSDTLTTDHVQTPCLFCFCPDLGFRLFDSNSSPGPETNPGPISVLWSTPDVAGAAGKLPAAIA